ncbi:TPA: hypothetical protein ACGSUT_003407 [Vibrio parahaemolyticus]|nr:hypothetical protein [Vibrio parahaemolyticus]MDF4763687.1 hypothetical protein [Vibrio parahaemolyticus]
MKVYGQKMIEVVVARCCDICGTSVMFDDEQDLPDEKLGQQPVGG